MIRDARIVTAAGVVEGDLAMEDGLIVAIGDVSGGDTVLDAEGGWLLPGAVDGHLHVSLGGYSVTEPLLHDLPRAASAALRGGVTTVGIYVQRTPVAGVLEALAAEIAREGSGVATDFFINVLVFPGDDIRRLVPAAASQGVTSFKTMFAYAGRGQMLQDEDICHLMAATAEVGGITLVHAENGGAIDYLAHLERKRGVTNESFLRSQPGVLEAEGMFRAATLAAITDASVHFAHCTSQEGVAMLRRLKEEGAAVTCETQFHYLELTNSEVLERGPLGKVGPPLKGPQDLEAVWKAVADCTVDHLSSDHSPKTLDVKMQSQDILDATFGGIAGTSVMLPLAFSHGYLEGRIGIERVVELTATGPARTYGLYPRKGVIAQGSDADLVLVPSSGERVRLTADALEPEAGYSLYESLSTPGFPTHVFRHGDLVVERGTMVGSADGTYLRRGDAA